MNIPNILEDINFCTILSLKFDWYDGELPLLCSKKMRKKNSRVESFWPQHIQKNFKNRFQKYKYWCQPDVLTLETSKGSLRVVFKGNGIQCNLYESVKEHIEQKAVNELRGGHGRGVI